MSEKLKEVIRLPFDFYDFFGYLFPGTFFTATSLVLYELSQSNQFSYYDWLREFVTQSSDVTFFSGLLLLFFLAIVLYLIGHVIATVSSVVMEKYLLKGMFGYPYNYYVKAETTHNALSKSFYRWSFVIGHFALISCCLAFYNDWPKWPSIVLVFSLLLLVLLRFSLVYLRHFGLSSKSSRLMKYRETFRKWLDSWMVKFTNCSIVWPTSTILGPTGILDSFSESFIDTFSAKFERDFGCSYKESGTNVFWLPYAYVLRNLPAASASISNFLHMYSFNRNMAMSCYLLVIFELLVLWNGFRPHVQNKEPLFIILMLLLVAGITLSVRYFYIFSSYYTKFLFRVYVSLPSD